MKRTYVWRRTDGYSELRGPRKGSGAAANVVAVFDEFTWFAGASFEVWPESCPTNKMTAYYASGCPRNFAIWDSEGQIYP